MANAPITSGPVPLGDSPPKASHPRGRFPADPVAPSGASAAKPGASAWDALRGSFGELREQAAYLAAAKLDAVKSIIRRTVLMAVVGVVSLIAAATVVVTAVVLLMQGIVGGLNRVLESTWLGQVIVGVVVVLVLAVAIVVGLKWVSGASKRATISKYDARKSQQRVRFGRDVEGNTNVR